MEKITEITRSNAYLAIFNKTGYIFSIKKSPNLQEVVEDLVRPYICSCCMSDENRKDIQQAVDKALERGKVEGKVCWHTSGNGFNLPGLKEDVHRTGDMPAGLVEEILSYFGF